jgi:hypothetical protein
MIKVAINLYTINLYTQLIINLPCTLGYIANGASSAKDKPSSLAGTSKVNKFAYYPFIMSSNISSQGVTLGFHTLSDESMGGGEDLHKQIMGMFQHVARYSKNMFVVLLEMSRLKLIN